MNRGWATSVFSVAVLAVIIVGCSRSVGQDSSASATLIGPSALDRRVEEAGASGGGGQTIGDIVVNGQFTFDAGGAGMTAPYSGSLDSHVPNRITIFLGAQTGTGRLEGTLIVFGTSVAITLDTTATTKP